MVEAAGIDPASGFTRNAMASGCRPPDSVPLTSSPTEGAFRVAGRPMTDVPLRRIDAWPLDRFLAGLRRAA